MDASWSRKQLRYRYYSTKTRASTPFTNGYTEDSPVFVPVVLVTLLTQSLDPSVSKLLSADGGSLRPSRNSLVLISRDRGVDLPVRTVPRRHSSLSGFTAEPFVTGVKSSQL